MSLFKYIHTHIKCSCKSVGESLEEYMIADMDKDKMEHIKDNSEVSCFSDQAVAMSFSEMKSRRILAYTRG